MFPLYSIDLVNYTYFSVDFIAELEYTSPVVYMYAYAAVSSKDKSSYFLIFRIKIGRHVTPKQVIFVIDALHLFIEHFDRISYILYEFILSTLFCIERYIIIYVTVVVLNFTYFLKSVGSCFGILYILTTITVHKYMRSFCK